MLWDCLNRYKKLYLEEKEKNARLMAQVLRNQVLLDSVMEVLTDLEKVKSLKLKY